MLIVISFLFAGGKQRHIKKGTHIAHRNGGSMVNEKKLKELMEAAGYTYDDLESEPGNLRFFTEAGTSSFTCWAEVYRWLNGVVLDDNGLTEKIEEGLKTAGDPVRMKVTLMGISPGKNTLVTVSLPADEEALKEQLRSDACEYVIVDYHGPLCLTGKENIYALNRLFVKFEDKPDEMFSIINSIYKNPDDISEKLENGFLYINFTEWTKDWTFADVHKDSDKGRVLYEWGWRLPKALDGLDRAKYNEWGDLIRWEAVWEDACTRGNWEVVLAEVNGEMNHFLVSTD